MLWKLLELHEAEAQRLIDEFNGMQNECVRLLGELNRPGASQKTDPPLDRVETEMRRFPLLAAYDHVLNCSHTFNLLDARGAISVTARVAVIGRVRKLAVGVAHAWMEQQADREDLVMGPPKSAGPGAAQGFARKNNVAVEALGTEVTPKGEYLALRRTVKGAETRELLAAALAGIIAKIPWPKAMYWTGKGGVTFIRPIRWIVALLGDRIVEFEVAGVRSRALSAGHRRMGSDEIAFEHANYEERLEKNGVILSAANRRERIQKGIKKLLRGTGLKLVADEALLNDLVYLTEYPTPLMGEFREEFLELPAEVLSTVMRHHQRYFTLTGGEGKMAPRFIAVMNMKADRKGYVKKGNERVLEARFNDAQFFWAVDRQRPLAARAPDL